MGIELRRESQVPYGAGVLGLGVEDHSEMVMRLGQKGLCPEHTAQSRLRGDVLAGEVQVDRAPQVRE